MAENSQPMALAGRRATTRAPTTMNAVNAGRYSNDTGSLATLPFKTARTAVQARPAPKTTSMDQATQVQRLPTGLPRLLRVSDRGL
jgi:hypothetical protein